MSPSPPQIKPTPLHVTMHVYSRKLSRFAGWVGIFLKVNSGIDILGHNNNKNFEHEHLQREEEG